MVPPGIWAVKGLAESSRPRKGRSCHPWRVGTAEMKGHGEIIKYLTKISQTHGNMLDFLIVRILA